MYVALKQSIKLQKATKTTKLTELPRDTDEFTITLEDFNTLDQKCTHLAHRKSLRTQLSSTTPSIKWIGMEIYTREYIFLKSYGIFTKTEHILSHKTHLKLKRIYIMSAFRAQWKNLENNRRTTGKSPNRWILSNTPKNKTGVRREISREIKNLN